jgi:hypothetical protein
MTSRRASSRVGSPTSTLKVRTALTGGCSLESGWLVKPVNLILSVTLAALVSLAYWQALRPLGRLLQRRETRILAVVTVEVE